MTLLCGDAYTRGESLHDTHTSKQLGPIDTYALNAHDIPKAVAQGHLDMGITGSDILREFSLSSKGIPLQVVKSFPDVHHWVLAVVGIDFHIGHTIVTEFPGIAAAEFPTHTLHPIRGSAEAWTLLTKQPALTIVETGKTIKQNGLSIQHTVQEAFPVLIAHPNIIASTYWKQLMELLQL